MSKREQLQAFREEAINSILSVMHRCHILTIEAVDVDAGSSPIIIEDPNDGNLTYTLDRIKVYKTDRERLLIQVSNCWDSADIEQDDLSTDTLLGLSEWVEENEDVIAEAYSAPDDRDEEMPWDYGKHFD